MPYLLVTGVASKQRNRCLSGVRGVFGKEGGLVVKKTGGGLMDELVPSRPVGPGKRALREPTVESLSGPVEHSIEW